MSAANLIRDLIRIRGPLTVAAFTDVALHHPEHGYYARTAQQSGRAGDFFTSVDVGPLFGELLARQVAEMAELLGADAGGSDFNLIEAGAGNGRLVRDILRALRIQNPLTYERTRLHLVETSAQARAAQRETLADTADRLASSGETMPEGLDGVILANELLDAMPVHQIVMRDQGLREVYVDDSDGRLVTRDGPLSTERLADHFVELEVALEPGWTAEVSLAAIDWTRHAVRRLSRGFVVLIDYGHDAAELYSASHSAGTLTSYSHHTSAGPEAHNPVWLIDPGEQDLTAHVDFTSIRRAAEDAGGTVLGFMDQTYFLMALATDRLAALDLKQRLALKTLLLPGGLGSTMKVLVIGKGVGTPSLTGCPPGARVT